MDNADALRERWEAEIQLIAAMKERHKTELLAAQKVMYAARDAWLAALSARDGK